MPKVERTSIPTLVPATLPAQVRFLGATITATSAVASQPTTASTEAETTAARPSNPGGPGEAINLTGDPKSGSQIFVANCQTCHAAQGIGGVSNPGSSDGTVPPLNPIDPTIADADYKTFATNIDLFVEHGSTPEGTTPTFSMPAWGDKKALTPQQIADVISYVISLILSRMLLPRKRLPPWAAWILPSFQSRWAGRAVKSEGRWEFRSVGFCCQLSDLSCGPGKGGIRIPVPGRDSSPLNPIDPTLGNSDHKVFAYNIDLFIEHGSTPAGPSPTFTMPAWGVRSFDTPTDCRCDRLCDQLESCFSLGPGNAFGRFWQWDARASRLPRRSLRLPLPQRCLF